jgi:hypothetical protein
MNIKIIDSEFCVTVGVIARPFWTCFFDSFAGSRGNSLVFGPIRCHLVGICLAHW